MGHGHSHAHGHSHGHHHGHGDAAIGWAVVVNLALTAAQIVGGFAADSVALVADGVHNLSDALALVLADHLLLDRAQTGGARGRIG